ncbi:MAG: 30S ribosomal protein S15 [Candidatus Aenigmarchaeota archaeon]|nr:30S ribosomal protein S15 [Candidatus Aenigmarchaeota archaeon]
MARMHSRKKGKSGSKKPMQKIAPWVTYSPKEIEEIILKFGRQGLQSSQIGTILRDQYGIPLSAIFTKKKMSKILKENGLYPKLPEDMLNLLKKAVGLRLHMEKNKKDYTSYRGLELTESKIRRLGKYYIRSKVLPMGWKYDPERARLLVK